MTVISLVAIIAALGFLFPQVLQWLISFLPVSEGLPSQVYDSLELGIQKVNSFSFIFPIDSMVQVIYVIVGFEFAILMFKLTVRILRLIRGG